MKVIHRSVRPVLAALLLAALPAAFALQVQILSLAPNGTMVWTNDQTNIWCGVQYTPGFGQGWRSAPSPYASFLTTNLSNSLTLPISTLSSGNPQLFFRLSASTSASNAPATYDVNANGIPLLVQSDYIELPKIAAISRFRSGEGHDYSDDFEHCRSMKHYFTIDTSVDATQVRIFSPVTGTVLSETPESATNSGTQVWITPTNYPAFTFILFHVNVTNTLPVGATVTNGQPIGLFGGEPGGVNSSDIAIQVSTPTGRMLLSYFDMMPANIFTNYQSRGVTNTQEMIITQAQRDADPLNCVGQTFSTPGTLTNQITLTPVTH